MSVCNLQGCGLAGITETWWDGLRVRAQEQMAAQVTLQCVPALGHLSRTKHRDEAFYRQLQVASSLQAPLLTGETSPNLVSSGWPTQHSICNPEYSWRAPMTTFWQKKRKKTRSWTSCSQTRHSSLGTWRLKAAWLQWGDDQVQDPERRQQGKKQDRNPGFQESRFWLLHGSVDKDTSQSSQLL